MRLRITILLKSLLLVALCSCTDKNPQSTAPENEAALIQKSPKRGISYDLIDAADFEAIKDGVSWWYNWHYQTNAGPDFHTDYQMTFYPMLWGGNTSDTDFILARSFIRRHPEIEYLLVMNEPNLTDQANRTPNQAAADWKRYETFVNSLKAERQIYLVGPAMTWGTMANFSDPVVWLDAFYAAYRQANGGRDPLIDFLAFHWYDYGLEAQLDRLQKYGKKIWITEMANWNPLIDSYEKQAEQMRQMVAVCENRDDVFRYAWFIGRGAEHRFTNLFEPAPGTLNELGELYLSLPYSK